MSKPIRVLVVEDDDKLTALYGKVLNHVGFQTRRATTIQDGLFLVKKFDPDIISLDWQIGSEVAEPILAYLATLDERHRPRTMLVSGKLIKAGQMPYPALEHVINVYVPKPVVLAELVNAVKQLTRNTLQQREPVHKVEIAVLAPEVVLVIWEGRLAENMVQGFSRVAATPTVILDLRACDLEGAANQKLAIPNEAWKSTQTFYVVYAESDLTVVRNLLGEMLAKTTGFLYTSREQAISAATRAEAE